MILVGGKAYELIQEHKDAWKPEAFKERYSEVLDRYDYIVGDWGYNQLRLKGFFKDGSNKGPKEAAIASVQDYIQEYCNFGCAYFILERLPGKGGAPDGTSPEEPIVEAEAVPAEDGEERPEGMQRIAGVAGGMGFSDRKPYSWREHQSTSRAARNAAAQAAAASAAAEKGDAAGGRAEQGGGPRRDQRQGGADRRGEGRPSGGRPFDKPRYQPQDRSEDGRGGERHGGGQRPQHGGGRKFPKGPRPGGGPGAGGPGAGGPGGGHAGPKGGPGGRGGRPDGGTPREQHAARPESAGGGRHAHANQGGGRDRAQQRHHHKPQPPQQQ